MVMHEILMDLSMWCLTRIRMCTVHVEVGVEKADVLALNTCRPLCSMVLLRVFTKIQVRVARFFLQGGRGETHVCVESDSGRRRRLRLFQKVTFWWRSRVFCRIVLGLAEPLTLVYAYGVRRLLTGNSIVYFPRSVSTLQCVHNNSLR